MRKSLKYNLYGYFKYSSLFTAYRILNTFYGIYSVIQKDGLKFILLYFLNYVWYIDDLHNV